MTVDLTTPQSRRALIGASLAGVAALAANALGRPSPVRALDPNDVVLGGTNTSVAQTTIQNNTMGPSTTVLHLSNSSGGAALAAATSTGRGVDASSVQGVAIRGSAIGGGPGVEGNGNNTSTGVVGSSGTTPLDVPAQTGVFGIATEDAASIGVLGQSDEGVGVKGVSTASNGVRGESTDGIAVAGVSTNSRGVRGDSTASVGVLGASAGNTGILGLSGVGPVSTPAKTGVYGFATTDSGARGVTGQSTNGRGVNGIATIGRGVHGQATTGEAGHFESATGTGLRVIGRARFDNCAGVATIAAGTNNVVVTPGSNLLTTSAVVATLQGSAGGTTTVHRVAVNATTDTFTIFLTANSTGSVKVAWHVFG